jgi:hypothetical protein
MLVQRQEKNLRAYFLWGSFLPTDNAAAARAATATYRAPDSVYFWTPDQRLAAELAATLRLPVGRVAWKVYLLYRQGTIWDRLLPMPAYWQQQLDVLQGDKFDITSMEVEIQRALRE